MSRISVMLGCCLSSDEMEAFRKEHPEFFEENIPEKNDVLEDDEEVLIVNQNPHV